MELDYKVNNTSGKDDECDYRVALLNTASH